MTRAGMILACGSGLLIALLACSGDDDDDRGPSSQPDKPARPVVVSDGGAEPGKPSTPSTLPMLCPSCQPRPAPGGDTTDFGSGAPPFACRGYRVTRMISLDEAEAAGFDPRADLAKLEGDHELPVRWKDSESDSTTKLSVAMRGTGRAQLNAFAEFPPGARLDLPPCPDSWSFALPEVELQIASDDHTIEGRLTGPLQTRTPPPIYENEVLWDHPYPWWSVIGDGAALRGALQLDGSGEPDALQVDVSVMYGDDAFGARAGLTLSWLRETAFGDGETGWGVLQPQLRALPLDGCQTFERPIDLGSCDPWTRVPGVGDACCVNVGERVPFVAPDGSVRDEDAGAATP